MDGKTDIEKKKADRNDLFAFAILFIVCGLFVKN